MQCLCSSHMEGASTGDGHTKMQTNGRWPLEPWCIYAPTTLLLTSGVVCHIGYGLLAMVNPSVGSLHMLGGKVPYDNKALVSSLFLFVYMGRVKFLHDAR